MRRTLYATAALLAFGLAAGCSSSTPPANPTPPTGKEPVREPAKGAAPLQKPAPPPP